MVASSITNETDVKDVVRVRQRKRHARIVRIQIKKGWALDQIKLTYDDGNTAIHGCDGGKLDPRILRLAKGECIVEVAHEKFQNLRYAGAGIEFTTNLGRTVKYYAKCACRLSGDIVRMKAQPGNQIYGLDIQEGVLCGILQQRAPSLKNVGRPACLDAWWVVSSFDAKEEQDGDKNGGKRTNVTHKHFFDSGKARTAMKAASLRAGKKTGRAAVLIDAKAYKVVWKVGDPSSVEQCVIDAEENGWCFAKLSEKPTMFATMKMLMVLLVNLNEYGDVRRDLLNMLFVLLCLLARNVLKVNAAVLRGQVMTIFDRQNLVEVRSNWMVRSTCSALSLSCDDASYQRPTLMALLTAFLVAKMMERLMFALDVYVHHNACDRKHQELHMLSFRVILGLDQSYFDVHSKNDIISASRPHGLNDLITWLGPRLFTGFIEMISTAAMMFAISPLTTLIVLIGYFVIHFAALKPLETYQKKVGKQQRKRERRAELIQGEGVSMTDTMRLFSQEKFHISEYCKAREDVKKGIDLVVKCRVAKEYIQGTFESVLTVAVLSFLVLGFNDNGNDAKGGGEGGAAAAVQMLSSGSLAGFLILFGNLQEHINHTTWVYEHAFRQLPDVERFVDLLKAEPKVVSGRKQISFSKTNHDGAAAAEVADGEIEFKNVTFRYPARPGQAVLKGLNLRFQPRKITAIVGESGAGKSTIAKLLMRVYDPCDGAVSIDGVDFREIDLESLHNVISIVNQNPTLFDRSLLMNIKYGSPVEPAVAARGGNSEETGEGASASASSVSIEQAVRMSNCEFINRFHGGLRTAAGALGKQLSGGQKQRIAIARAAMRDPRVLILDEATSALDTKNEQVVQAALEKLMKGRTIIIIAHRLSTIKNAHEIVCMRDGRVAEQGTHDELMKQKGHYYGLIRRQVFSK